MNDFIQKLLDFAAQNLDGYIILIVLCSGYFQKMYFKGFTINKKDASYDSALKTLGLSFFISVIYILLTKNPNSATNWGKYFISYFTATSLYELLVDKFVEWVQSKINAGAKP